MSIANIACNKDQTVKKQLYPLAKQWREVFRPYSQKYRIKSNKTGKWIEVEKPLTDQQITNAINGKTTIGYVSSLKTHIIGIDIDYHTGNPWKNSKPCIELQKKYNRVISRLGYFPSILFKSPHGLHIYYLFTYIVPHKILADRLREKLCGLSDEILPTPNHALRIDPIKNCIDPETFRPIPLDLDINTIHSYNPATILDCTCLPGEKRATNNESRSKERTGKKISQEYKLEKIENSILPIEQGNTNEQIFRSSLLPTYYWVFNGDVDTAVDRIISHLLIPSGYKGELLRLKRLYQRINSSFRAFERNSSEFSAKAQQIQLSSPDKCLIEDLTQQHPFSQQRTESIKNFLENLFSWLGYQNDILQDKESSILWDWYYKRYCWYREKGFYPLPSAMLKSWNNQYRSILDWLEEIKILKQETKHYFDQENPYNSICRFYSVNRVYKVRPNSNTNFIEELKTSELSQRELSKILGVSNVTISHWIKGTKKISNKNLTKCQSNWETYKKAC